MREGNRVPVWLALALLFAGGCAQVGSPDGGAKDDAPPVVVSASPACGTTDLYGTVLKLTFDEFVQVQDARNQVLVSPPPWQRIYNVIRSVAPSGSAILCNVTQRRRILELLARREVVKVLAHTRV